MHQPTVLVFECTSAARDALSESLLRHGFSMKQACEPAGLTRLLLDREPDLVILGPSVIGPGNILDVVRQVRQFARSVPLLVIPLRSSEELAIAALRAGISDYVKYPIQENELIEAVKRCLSRSGMAPVATSSKTSVLAERGGIIGEGASMREVRERLARIAVTDCNILITGETGTGKELVANLVYKESPRRNKPFITINCAAIPDTLIESELFGYERGAFTGAQSRKDGKLQAADGGTVFLDEIGDMSGYGQAKILRMIEGKEIQRLGRNGGISVDVRILAATNQDLDKLVRDEKFRKDLFFRLNVARIDLPPLRERKEDLPCLIDYYICYFNTRFGRRVRQLSDNALECLMVYDWPGNVRELKNLLEVIFVELPPEEVATAELPAQFGRRCRDVTRTANAERERLLWALSTTNWNKSKAADKLHWSRMTLYRKLAKYNILRERERMSA
jgi:DNA-binding NtrC family response regulator